MYMGFNRDIVECKEKVMVSRLWVLRSFNRDIVECKGEYAQLESDPADTF